MSEDKLTPDATAEADTEDASAGSGTTLAAIAAALRTAGVSAARNDIDRAFSRDSFDTDIGYHEGLRTCLLMGFQGLTALDNTLNHTKAMAALQAQTITHQRDSDDAFFGGLSKADSTFHQSLMKSYGLETDNEVLSTVALAKVVQALANDVAGIKQAIADATAPPA